MLAFGVRGGPLPFHKGFGMMEKSGLQVRMEADEEKLGVLLDRISLVEDKIMTQQRM